MVEQRPYTALVGGSTPLSPTSVAYDARGQGERGLIFVHGASADRALWHHQMAGLDCGRRLVALDLPGHGESDVPNGPYTLDSFVRAVEAVLDAEGLPRAVLVGHSNGVPVVRHFLRLHPQRCEALALLDGALRPMLAPPMVEWMRTTLARPDYDEQMRAMTEQTPRGALSEDDYALVLRVARPTSREALAGWLDAFEPTEIWTPDPIDVPLLVLRAEHPRASTHEDEAFVRGLAPAADYRAWPDVSHFLMLERPARCNRAISELLERVD